MGGKITIGLIQTAVSDNIKSNVDKTIMKIREAASKKSKIICLQELFKTKYFCQYEKKKFTKFAEKIPGETTTVFSGLAKELEVVIIAPLFEKNGKDYYNSAVVIDADGKLLDTYRKIHIPYDGCYYEKNYFKEGNDYKIFNTKYAKIAVLICYDQWFPEAARICVLKGADIIFYPTAIGWIKGVEPVEGNWHNAWETVQRGHAIANGIHVAAVNRVGEEEKLKFWGGSFVCDSFGNIISKASDKEEVLVAEVDLNKNKIVRDGWGFLRNRRPKTYDLLVK